MKLFPGYTDLFLSPVTGSLNTSSLPSLELDYIWVGNRHNQADFSPALIDLRLSLIDLRHQLDAIPAYAPLEGSYLTGLTESSLPNSQSLESLKADGILKTVDHTLSLAIAGQDYVTPKPSFLTSLKEETLANSQSLEGLKQDGLLKTVDNQLKLAVADEDYLTPEGLEKQLEPIQEEIKELQEFEESARIQFEDNGHA